MARAWPALQAHRPGCMRIAILTLAAALGCGPPAHGWFTISISSTPAPDSTLARLQLSGDAAIRDDAVADQWMHLCTRGPGGRDPPLDVLALPGLTPLCVDHGPTLPFLPPPGVGPDYWVEAGNISRFRLQIFRTVLTFADGSIAELDDPVEAQIDVQQPVPANGRLELKVVLDLAASLTRTSAGQWQFRPVLRVIRE